MVPIYNHLTLVIVFCLQLTTSVQNNISIIWYHVQPHHIFEEWRHFFFLSFSTNIFLYLSFLYMIRIMVISAKWKAAVPRKFTHFPIAIKLPFHRYVIPQKYTIQMPNNNNNNMLCTCKALYDIYIFTHWYRIYVSTIIYPPTLFHMVYANGVLL